MKKISMIATLAVGSAIPAFGSVFKPRPLSFTEPVLFTETAGPKWPGDYEERTGLALVLGAQALRIETPGIDSLTLDPIYGNFEGSWRQILFPSETPAPDK